MKELAIVEFHKRPKLRVHLPKWNFSDRMTQTTNWEKKQNTILVNLKSRLVFVVESSLVIIFHLHERIYTLTRVLQFASDGWEMTADLARYLKNVPR